MTTHDVRFIKFFNNEFSLKFAQTDKSFFIYNMKIASRYLSNVSGFPSLNYIVSGNDLKIINTSPHFHEDVYTNTIIQDWEDVKSGTTKKDIIIVYRNPIDRLASAILQDAYSFVLAQNSNLYIYPLMENLGYKEHEIDLLYTVFQETAMWVEPNKEEILEKMFFDIIGIYFENFLKRASFEDSHYLSHMLPIVKLLTTTNIDTNKITMINLDTQPDELESYLKKVEIYNPPPKEISFEPKSGNRKDRLEYILKLIIKENNHRVVMERIKGELYAYNILTHYHKKLQS